MTKAFKKMKFLILMFVLAVAIFLPCNDFIVQASSLPIKISTTGTDGEDAGGSGTSGSTNSSGESGSTATEDNTERIPYNNFTGIPLGESIIKDKYLYQGLLKIFNDYLSNEYPGIYTNVTVVYSDMFKDFDEINLDSCRLISSLNGLEELDLSNLVSFSVNHNRIETFDEDVFQHVNIEKFNTLSLAGNSLSSFNIQNLIYLTDINLSSNGLSSLDLSKIEGRQKDTVFSLNIANNKFTSISNIILPTKRIGHVNINLINNQISSIDDEYFSDKYTLSLGVFGFKLIEEMLVADTKTNLLVGKTNLENVRIDIMRVDQDDDILVRSIREEDILGNYLTLDLEVGEYKYQFKYDNEDEDAYDAYDENGISYLKSNRFNFIPQKVTYLYNFEGKDYETLNKVTGVVTVKLFCEEGATIMYQVNGGEWVEGNVVECDKGGTYSIKVKAKIGDFESEVESIWVRTSLNIYISDGLMLAMVLIFVLILFFVVLPLISRRYFKKD